MMLFVLMVSKRIAGLSHSAQWIGENWRGLSSSHDAHIEGKQCRGEQSAQEIK